MNFQMNATEPLGLENAFTDTRHLAKCLWSVDDETLPLPLKQIYVHLATGSQKYILTLFKSDDFLLI